MIVTLLPSIDYSDYDSDNIMTTSISETAYTDDGTLLSFWMHIKQDSISFEVGEQTDEASEINFKFYKEIKIDMLNTSNEKLSSIEDTYKKEIYSRYM